MEDRASGAWAAVKCPALREAGESGRLDFDRLTTSGSRQWPSRSRVFPDPSLYRSTRFTGGSRL